MDDRKTIKGRAQNTFEIKIPALANISTPELDIENENKINHKVSQIVLPKESKKEIPSNGLTTTAVYKKIISQEFKHSARKVNCAVSEEYKEKINTIAYIYNLSIADVLNNILAIFFNESSQYSLNENIKEDLLSKNQKR